jgi:hypothetical protein
MSAMIRSRGVQAIRRSNEFNPNVFAGLQLWLPASGTYWQDSDRTIPATADNDPVGAWDDASGNGRHMIQPTSGSRPLLKTATANGRHGLLFDGVDDTLIGPLTTVTTGGTVTFIVAKRTGSAKGAWIKNGTGANGWGWGVGNASFDTFGNEFLGLLEGFRWVDGNVTAPTALTVFCGRWVASDARDARLHVNANASVASNVGSGAVINPTDMTWIGGYPGGATGRYQNGTVVEILVYNTFNDGDSTTCVQTIGPLLAARFGTTWT